MKRYLLIGVVVLLLAIQLIQPQLNTGNATGPADITHAVSVPAEVSGLLKQSCYDCHSNHTTYPWYDRIAPVSWWVAGHINDGKRELNFTEFGTYSPKKQGKKLEEIGETVEEGEMPLKSYLITHGDARLTEAQKKTLVDWAQGAGAEVGRQP
jgi:hypothetical protein